MVIKVYIDWDRHRVMGEQDFDEMCDDYRDEIYEDWCGTREDYLIPYLDGLDEEFESEVEFDDLSDEIKDGFYDYLMMVAREELTEYLDSEYINA